METDVWRGQMRAPADVIEWLKAHAKSRFTSLNSVVVEALREYQERRSQEQEAKQ